MKSGLLVSPVLSVAAADLIILSFRQIAVVFVTKVLLLTWAEEGGQ